MSDSPIYIAMALVAAAIGVGLFLQLGVAGWLAVMVALSLLMTMLSLHLLGGRAREIRELRADLRRLETELRRAPMARHGAAPATSVAPPHAAPQPAVAAQRQPRTVPGPGRVPVLGEPAAPAVEPTRADRPETSRPDTSRSEMGRSEMGRPDAGRPEVGRDEAIGLDLGRADVLRPTTHAAAPPQPAPQPAPAPSAAARIEAAARSSRPTPEPVRQETRAAQPAGRDVPPAPAAEPANASDAPGRDPWSFRPADEIAAETSPARPAVRDSDVEVIQGLIKKLADEVNANEADTAAATAAATRRASDTLTETAIENSLEALRTTAGTMRERDESAASRRTGREMARSQPREPRFDAPSAPSSPAAPAAPQRLARDQRERIEPSFDMAPDGPASRTSFDRDMGGAGAHAVDAPTGRVGGSELASDVMGAGDIEAWSEAGADAAPGRNQALTEAVTAQRVDVFLEPILTLVDQRPRHYEVQVRPRAADGQTFGDDAMLHAELGGSGLLPLLDRTRIARVSVIARRLAERGRDSSIFSAFSGESLIDDGFLNDFANAFHERDSFASQLVLTFSLADVRAITPRERASLEDMRDLGFRFAIDHVTDLDVDFEDLRAQGFHFVKLDADVFLDGLPASGGLIPASDICRHLSQLGMTLIVGEIADEDKFARIFGFGVLFGQGQLFGGPRLVKAEPPVRRTAA